MPSSGVLFTPWGTQKNYKIYIYIFFFFFESTIPSKKYFYPYRITVDVASQNRVGKSKKKNLRSTRNISGLVKVSFPRKVVGQM